VALVGERRAKQPHVAVAHYLIRGPVVPVDGVHHLVRGPGRKRGGLPRDRGRPVAPCCPSGRRTGRSLACARLRGRLVSWPLTVRQVRGWLAPWHFLQRCWHAWSSGPRRRNFKPCSMPSAPVARSTYSSANNKLRVICIESRSSTVPPSSGGTRGGAGARGAPLGS
jgi:hypothetical protein